MLFDGAGLVEHLGHGAKPKPGQPTNTQTQGEWMTPTRETVPDKKRTSNSEVASFPPLMSRICLPPGCLSRKEVTLRTCLPTMIQQSVSDVCLAWTQTSKTKGHNRHTSHTLAAPRASEGSHHIGSRICRRGRRAHGSHGGRCRHQVLQDAFQTSGHDNGF